MTLHLSMVSVGLAQVASNISSSCEPGSWDNLYLCQLDGNGAWWGWVIEVLIFAYCFAALAIICDDHLVVSLETLCVRNGVREDVAGATFMAFGSSAPEIIVNAVATIKGLSASSDSSGGGAADAANLGVGAIVGSGVIAFSLIPGACAVFAGGKLEIKRRPLIRDISAYSVSLLLLCVFFQDGEIQLYEGLSMLGVYAVYVAVVFASPGIRRNFREHVQRKKFNKKRSFVEEREAALLLESQLSSATLEDTPEEDTGGSRSFCEVLGNVVVYPLNLAFRLTCPPCERGSRTECLYPVTFCASFVWVSVFSFIISTVVSRWGELSNAPLSFLGFLLVAVGAEIPDTVQSVTVARRGYGSMAVGNAIGSQIVNICVGLGLPWTISAASRKPPCISEHASILDSVYFQVANIAFISSLLIGPVILYAHNKAHLTRRKGIALITCFATIQVVHTVFVFALPTEPRSVCTS